MSSGFNPDQSAWLFEPSDLLRTPSATHESHPLSLPAQLGTLANAVNLAAKLLAIHFKGKGNTESVRHAAGVAAIYIHRFFMRASMWDAGWREVAWAALFLALKDTERASRLETVVRLLLQREYKDRREEYDARFSGPQAASQKEFQRFQAAILFHEEILAATVTYDLAAETPYASFSQGWRRQASKGWRKGLDAWHHCENLGWDLIDQALESPLPVLQPPAVIACAAYVVVVSMLSSGNKPFEATLDTLGEWAPCFDFQPDETRGREAVEESICWILRPMLLIDPDEPSHGFLQTNRIKAKRYRNFRRSLGVWAQRRPKPLDGPDFEAYKEVGPADAEAEEEEVEEGEVEDFSRAASSKSSAGNRTPLLPLPASAPVAGPSSNGPSPAPTPASTESPKSPSPPPPVVVLEPPPAAPVAVATDPKPDLPAASEPPAPSPSSAGAAIVSSEPGPERWGRRWPGLPDALPRPSPPTASEPLPTPPPPGVMAPDRPLPPSAPPARGFVRTNFQDVSSSSSPQGPAGFNQNRSYDRGPQGSNGRGHFHGGGRLGSGGPGYNNLGPPPPTQQEIDDWEAPRRAPSPPPPASAPPPPPPTSVPPPPPSSPPPPPPPPPSLPPPPLPSAPYGRNGTGLNNGPNPGWTRPDRPENRQPPLTGQRDDWSSGRPSASGYGGPPPGANGQHSREGAIGGQPPHRDDRWMPGHEPMQHGRGAPFNQGQPFDGPPHPHHPRPDQRRGPPHQRPDYRSDPPHPTHYGMSGPQASRPDHRLPLNDRPLPPLPRPSSHYGPPDRGQQSDSYRPGGAYMDGRDPRESYLLHADPNARMADTTEASSPALDYGGSPPHGQPSDRHQPRRYGPFSGHGNEPSGGSHRRSRDDEDHGRDSVETWGETHKRPRLESNQSSHSSSGPSQRLPSPSRSAYSTSSRPSYPPAGPQRSEAASRSGGPSVDANMDDDDADGSFESGEIAEKPALSTRRPSRFDSGAPSAPELENKLPHTPSGLPPSICTKEVETSQSTPSLPLNAPLAGPSDAAPTLSAPAVSQTVSGQSTATLASDASLRSPAMPASPANPSVGNVSPSSPPLLPPSPGPARDQVKTVKIKRPSGPNGTSAAAVEASATAVSSLPATSSLAGGKPRGRPPPASMIFERAMQASVKRRPTPGPSH